MYNKLYSGQQFSACIYVYVCVYVCIVVINITCISIINQ